MGTCVGKSVTTHSSSPPEDISTSLPINPSQELPRPSSFRSTTPFSLSSSSPKKSSSNRSLSLSISPESFSLVYNEFYLNYTDVQIFKDIFLSISQAPMAQSPTSTISPALPSSPNYSLEEIHITFEHFFDYFSLEKTPFNYQLFYLWLQPPSSPPSTILLQASSTTPSTTTPLSMNYLFFICSIWYVLTMEQEDIAAFIFNLYATAKGPSTKYITVSSIKTALDHIHPFATCNKLLQKLIKDLPNEIDGLTFAEWWEWCSEHTMILEPIFQQQNQLRQAIGTNDLWKALTIKRTQNPSQNNPNYLIFLHNLYDEAMLKYALTSRLNDLTKLKTRSYSFTRESDSLIQPNIDIDPMISASEDDYPQLTLKRKPSGSSSSTASVQNLVIVSNCSTPFSAAGVILHDVMYDTDGDSISIPSPGSGKCSDYESIFYEDPENPPGRWDTKDGDDGLLSPRSVLSEANCYDESEDDDNEQQ